MKPILQRQVQEPDKSFILYYEKEPFFSSPWHFHLEYELVLITRSSGKRIVGDHIGYFQEGDLVFIGSQLPHVYDNDPEYLQGDPNLFAEAIVIHFLPEFLGEKFFRVPELLPFVKILEKSSQGLKITGETSQRIASLMKAMPNMDGLQRLVSLMSIFEILSKTTEYELLANRGFMNNFDVLSTDRVKKVTEYIMRNFAEDISLNVIANVANITPTNFCIFFKKYYRTTFVRYLSNIRVGYACKLLGEDKNNISQIAHESGFKNISNFNRQFKKVKGMNPTEYRESLSKKN